MKSCVSDDVINLSWNSPLELAEKVKKMGFMVWFDSNQDSSSYCKKHCIDIITAVPEIMIYAKKFTIHTHNIAENKVETTQGNPFFVAQKFLDQYAISTINNSIPFCGGIAGYWGYELNHTIEPKYIKYREHESFDMALGVYLWALIINNKTKTVQLYFHQQINKTKRKMILDTVLSKSTQHQDNSFNLLERFQPCITRNEYFDAHRKIIDYIRCGDCYQVNLTHAFSASYQGDLWKAYKVLRKVSPTTYSAWIDFECIKLLSHSPEQFLKVRDRCVQTSPIKGTRPRSKCLKTDKKFAQELQKSIKDRAENLMIVDLLRNDLNRYCVKNSVKVTKLFSLESYANVHHLVTTIQGTLRSDIDLLQLLRGAFPGGSVTGAPKIRAMQIIRDLELQARAAYCGAIGYISFNGNMDTNIPIRTLIGLNHKLLCYGGGAIVADSLCDNEYEESLQKINNLISALESHFMQ